MYSHFIKLVNEPRMNGIDGTAVGVGLMAFFQWIPHLSALATFIWIMLRIWVTVRDDFLNKKDKDGNE
jgi:hypothetical protein